MQESRSPREMLAALLARPDEIMLEVGAGGELMVARLRAIIAGLLLLLPLANSLAGGSVKETLTGLAGAVLITVIAQAWLMLARRRRQYRWLPVATTTFDVSVTTMVLVMLGTQHLPAALNSLIVWCGYLLAILLTALRSDGRITLFAGALSMLQYGTLVAVVFHVAASPEQLISASYGQVTFGSQLQRLGLLAIGTLITAVVVYRMQRLIELSGTDGLTRLPNRTWLLHRMPRLIDSAEEEGGSLTVALIDLDNFRRINEQSGHRHGDRILRQFANLLRDTAEQGDWLVRLGAEEFALVLRKPAGTAWERVDAIRRLVAERSFEADRTQEPLRLTFSAGLAAYPHDGRNLSELLRRADQRLRMAKREGRNRVVARDA